MSAHGSHAILVLPIPYKVPNRLSTTGIHVTNKMPIGQVATAGQKAFT